MVVSAGYKPVLNFQVHLAQHCDYHPSQDYALWDRHTFFLKKGDAVKTAFARLLADRQGKPLSCALPNSCPCGWANRKSTLPAPSCKQSRTTPFCSSTRWTAQIVCADP